MLIDFLRTKDAKLNTLFRSLPVAVCGVTRAEILAVIATLGIANSVEVWARDPHFPVIQNILPALRLFQEPPSAPT